MSQEIWVKEMPKSCFDCPIIVEGIEGYDCCVCAFLVKAAETKNRLKDCPLKSLHDHDKELVAKVLKKVKRKVDNISMHTATKERLMIMCEEIQKEFEDEK